MPHTLRPERLSAVFDLVETRFSEPIHVEDMAGVAFLSPFHFSRCFKTTTGMSPYTYLTQRRIEKAREMLVATDSPLSTIARATGFATQAHFCGTFKQHVGTTPGSFRRMHRPMQEVQADAVHLDRDRVQLDSEDAIASWTRTLGVSREILEEAVATVGPSTGRVYDYLTRNRQRAEAAAS